VAFALFLALFLALTSVWAEPSPGEKADPTLKSISPLGGRQDSRFDAVVRGQDLQGAQVVWFDCPQLKAQVRSIREIEPEPDTERPYVSPGKKEEKKPFQEVRLRVEIDPAAHLGAHALHLVTPRGVSDARWLLVDSEPVIPETEEPHETPTQAQSLDFPVVVNGKLASSGELDYYSFQVEAGQELQLEVRANWFPQGPAADLVDPELVLYETGGSWFDPDRGRRLEVRDLWRPPLGDFFSKGHQMVTAHRLPRVRRVFAEAGRYVAQVGTLDGSGGPDYSYQLRILPLDSSTNQQPERWGPLVSVHATGLDTWERHDFTAEMGANRLDRLQARTGSSETSLPALSVLPEREPNDAPEQAHPIPVPTLLQGAVDSALDVDWFQIRVKEGEKLAFEIETPDASPPVFNPKIRVMEANGERELVTNIYRWIAGDGDDWIKRIEPKTIYSFGGDEEYLVQVRDLTARNGSSSFRYRILIRPQIPHMGKIDVMESRINLARGEAAKLTVITEQEEGYSGDISLEVENLPPGVRVSTATQVEEETPPPLNDGAKELYLPKSQKAIILLAASADAPLTRLPQVLRVMARPVVEGKIGTPALVREVPLMVLKPVLKPVVKPDATEGDAPEGSEKEGSKKEP
jgi:hypothetical protein